MSGTKAGRKLGRTTAHRTALYRNLATSLIRYEHIETTEAKAKSLKRFIERLISRAKINDIHSKRIVARDIKDKDVFAKLFTVVVPRYVQRTGGYVRLVKTGRRFSDNSKMCVIKLIA